MRTAEQIAAQEIYAPASQLISALSKEFANDHFTELTQAATALCYPVPDFEEAATQAGWRYETARMTGTSVWRHEDDPRTAHLFSGWQDLCESEGIEPYMHEPMGWWIVSDWLAERLEEKGESVDRDFAGLCIWARLTCGQAIDNDEVIQQIAQEIK